MDGYEYDGITGEWMPPPSPSSRAFFSAMLGDDDDDDDRRHHRTCDDNENEHKKMEQEAIKPVEQKMGLRGGGLLERRIGFNAPRLNTESIRPPLQNPPLSDTIISSPFFTLPPGLSPTSLLDSPVFLSNSLVQPSPTTGKFPFPFPPSGSGRTLTRDGDPEKSRDNDLFDSCFTSSFFAFKPVPESTPSLFLGATVGTKAKQISSIIEEASVSVQSDNSTILPRNDVKVDNSQSSGGGGINYKLSSEPSRGFDEEEEQDDEVVEDGDNNVAEDGYNWRKYGQKQVKGSEYPRSYYKCTHPNCPVKKKVERSQQGHITEIIYKSLHNHPKPHSLPSTNHRRSNGITGDMQSDDDWRRQEHDNVEVSSSEPPVLGGVGADNSVQHESATFSNEEDEEDTHGSASLGGGSYDGEEDESESKRRKVEAYAAATAADVSGASRGMREPRVVVQTTSEVDILDDGYRWRKYGQKVVKGNPNPRSYYKCTNAGCAVRKHVERASHDLKSVITTYEGKHNHDVPAARNNSSSNIANSNNNIMISSPFSSQPGAGAGAGAPSQVQRAEERSQLLQNNIGRFERPPHSFGLPPGMRK